MRSQQIQQGKATKTKRSQKPLRTPTKAPINPRRYEDQSPKTRGTTTKKGERNLEKEKEKDQKGKDTQVEHPRDCEEEAREKGGTEKGVTAEQPKG